MTRSNVKLIPHVFPTGEFFNGIQFIFAAECQITREAIFKN